MGELYDVCVCEMGEYYDVCVYEPGVVCVSVSWGRGVTGVPGEDHTADQLFSSCVLKPTCLLGLVQLITGERHERTDHMTVT